MMHHALLALMLAASPAAAALAQQADSSSLGTAVVTGYVYDSVGSRRLGGARVQLASIDSLAKGGLDVVADSAGRFSIPSVAAGRYLVGFFHPILDSLGIESPVSVVRARAGVSTRVVLAVPSPRRIRDALCDGANADSTGVIVGHLHDAESGRGIAGGGVTVAWNEVTVDENGVHVGTPTLSGRTSETGWFAFCHLPITTELVMQGVRGADSTAVIPMRIPATGLVRRELSVGRSQSVVVGSGAAGGADSLAARTVRRGTARLRGIVRRAGSQQPLAGARVSVLGADGLAITNDEGRFEMAMLPSGTQVVETKAIGFFPDSRAIDLSSRRTASIDVVLPTLKSVLDTIRVMAKRVYSSDAHGFERRRRAGWGKFLSADDVARLDPFSTTSIFRGMPSIQIRGTENGGFEERVYMRALIGGLCAPDVYIDGMRLADIGARDLDTWISPDEIDGIEIYTRTGMIPPEFMSFNNDCGVIVIWRRPPS